jgi:hypothetical protein
MFLSFNPIIMLGMIFDQKVFGILAVSNDRLILLAFIRCIFSLMLPCKYTHARIRNSNSLYRE